MGSRSIQKSSMKAPAMRPVYGSPRIRPISGAATIGREIMACKTIRSRQRMPPTIDTATSFSIMAFALTVTHVLRLYTPDDIIKIDRFFPGNAPQFDLNPFPVKCGDVADVDVTQEYRWGTAKLAIFVVDVADI